MAYFLMLTVPNIQNMKNIKGKVVVITGASSGAGRAIAIRLASEGTRLVLAARREEALQEVAGEVAVLGGIAKIVVTDVKEMSAVHRLTREAVKEYGFIDVWINNAGVLAAGAVEDVSTDVTADVIRTNLLGYIHGAQAALPIFKQQGHGVLINNISVGGWIATPYMAAYCASKFGLRGFFESLKGELRNFPGIHICDLYPAFLDTPGIQHAANYTGKTLRPAPPVYDPARVADAVVKLINNPKEQKAIGSAAVLLKVAYGIFPSITRNITASLIRTYLKNAEETTTTPGNVLETVPFGTSVGGGWQPYFNSALLRRGVLLSAGLTVIGLLATKFNKA